MSESAYMPKSKSDTHLTPDRVWELIDIIWGYKQKDFFDPCLEGFQVDGLTVDWKELNYVNPPYTLLTEFVQKAHQEVQFGHKTVLLLPSKTDQDWFHDYILHNMDRYEIKWIRKRLKFKNNKWSATQPHFLVLMK